MLFEAIDVDSALKVVVFVLENLFVSIRQHTSAYVGIRRTYVESALKVVVFVLKKLWQLISAHVGAFDG